MSWGMNIGTPLELVFSTVDGYFIYDIWLTNQKGWCGNYKYDYNDIHVIRHLYVLGERYYSPSDQYYEIARMEKGEFDRVEKSEQYKNAIRRYRRFAPVSMDNDI